MAIVNYDYNLKGDVQANRDLREYAVWRYHAGGEIKLYLNGVTPPGLYENPAPGLMYPMRFGMRNTAGVQPNSSIQFNWEGSYAASRLWKSFGHHPAGSYAVNARFAGSAYSGTIWWTGTLRVRKYDNV